MKSFKIKFYGRSHRSNDETYPRCEVVKAATYQDAVLKLYDRYEHIHNEMELKLGAFWFEYSDYSETVRMMPQNYMVLAYINYRMVLDFDYAVPDRVLSKTIEILKDNVGATPWTICERLNFAFNANDGIQTREVLK